MNGGLIVTPAARQEFSAEELAAAFSDYRRRGPEYRDEEHGVAGSVYRVRGHSALLFLVEEEGVAVILALSGEIRAAEREVEDWGGGEK